MVITTRNDRFNRVIRFFFLNALIFYYCYDLLRFTCIRYSGQCFYNERSRNVSRAWSYRQVVYSRIMSNVTALEMGGNWLLLDAWHVNTVFRWRRSSRSRRNVFFTFRSGNVSNVSSISACSCHHVTRGGGRPGKRKTKKKNYKNMKNLAFKIDKQARRTVVFQKNYLKNIIIGSYR